MAEGTDWNQNHGLTFGVHKPEDEFFHGWGAQGDSMTETWYWGFNVPEAKINCFIYCWVHPNLKVVTSGPIIYKGFKRHHLASELFDVRQFMSSAIIGDGRDFQLPNSFRVQVIEPLKHVRLTFDDPKRETSFDVDSRAVWEPVMRGNNQHFEQVMKVTGRLTLRGEEHKVDCYQVRDRSWGELRPEDAAPLPPYTWVTGVFGEDMAFNLGAHEDPAQNPHWLKDFPMAPENAFRDGWVIVKGEKRRLTRGSISIQRDAALVPVRHDIEMEDTTRQIYRLQGDIFASVPWSGWSNMLCNIGCVNWAWDGRKGVGETQDVQWNDYVWRYSGQA